MRRMLRWIGWGLAVLSVLAAAGVLARWRASEDTFDDVHYLSVSAERERQWAVSAASVDGMVALSFIRFHDKPRSEGGDGTSGGLEWGSEVGNARLWGWPLATLS